MKLTTKAILADFEKYPFHSQADKGGEAHVICKYALPSHTWEYYVLEAEPLDLDVGVADKFKIKAGDTWGLRGIVFNSEHPNGEYSLFVLAEMERRAAYTPMKNEDTQEVEYVEEYVERCKDFVPCRVADIVQDIYAITADEFCSDMRTPKTKLDKAMQDIGRIMENMDGCEE